MEMSKMTNEQLVKKRRVAFEKVRTGILFE